MFRLPLLRPAGNPFRFLSRNHQQSFAPLNSSSSFLLSSSPHMLFSSFSPASSSSSSSPSSSSSAPSTPPLTLSLPSARSRSSRLRRLLRQYRSSYYTDGRSDVSDDHFDSLMRELRDIEKLFPQIVTKSSPTQTVGETMKKVNPKKEKVKKMKTETKEKKITEKSKLNTPSSSPSSPTSSVAFSSSPPKSSHRHSFPMLSLNSVHSIPSLENWIKTTEKSLLSSSPSTLIDYQLEPKYDGIALSLLYENGLLVGVYTRGDGTKGEDITENFKIKISSELKPKILHIKNNNENISLLPSMSFEVRGEAIIDKKDFLKWKNKNNQIKTQSENQKIKIKDEKEKDKKKTDEDNGESEEDDGEEIDDEMDVDDSESSSPSSDPSIPPSSSPSSLSISTARNLVSGALRRIHQDISKSANDPNIQFIAYSIHFEKEIEENIIGKEKEKENEKGSNSRGESSSLSSLETPPSSPSLPPLSTQSSRISLLSSLGFLTPPTHIFPSITKSVLYDHLHEWTKTLRDAFPYVIDGMVIKINSLNSQQILSFSTTAPRWAIAFKFPPKTSETKLLRVEWRVGRSGKCTPLGILEPVECGGVTVRKVSLHNALTVKTLHLTRGCRVKIQRSGDVIPNMIAVTGREDEAKEDDTTKTPLVPTNCPCELHSPLLSVSSDVFCVLPSCPSQRLHRIRHFVSKEGIHVKSLGIQTLSTLVKEKRVDGCKDIVEMVRDEERKKKSAESLMNLKGFQHTKIHSLLNTIEAAVLSATPLQLLVSLGIPSAGKSLCHKLLQSVNFDIFVLLNMDEKTFDSLSKSCKLSAQRGKIFYDFLNHKDNKELILMVINIQEEHSKRKNENKSGNGNGNGYGETSE